MESNGSTRPWIALWPRYSIRLGRTPSSWWFRIAEPGRFKPVSSSTPGSLMRGFSTKRARLHLLGDLHLLGGLRMLVRQVLPKPAYSAAARLRQTLLTPRRRKPRDCSIDWPRTAAYAVGVDSGIAINLRGREPGGIVEPGTEYRDVCDRIIARLRALVDPDTNQPAVDRIHRASELYAPRVAARAPDLCVQWRGAAYLPSEIEDVPGAVFVSHRQRGKVLPNTGGHRPDGLLLAMGFRSENAGRDPCSTWCRPVPPAAAYPARVARAELSGIARRSNLNKYVIVQISS